eukprot:g14009.t1
MLALGIKWAPRESGLRRHGDADGNEDRTFAFANLLLLLLFFLIAVLCGLLLCGRCLLEALVEGRRGHPMSDVRHRYAVGPLAAGDVVPAVGEGEAERDRGDGARVAGRPLEWGRGEGAGLARRPVGHAVPVEERARDSLPEGRGPRQHRHLLGLRGPYLLR